MTKAKAYAEAMTAYQLALEAALQDETTPEPVRPKRPELRNDATGSIAACLDPDGALYIRYSEPDAIRLHAFIAEYFIVKIESTR